MNKIANNLDTSIELRREIEQLADELVVEDVKKLGEGMDTVAYEVNEKYVFRLAKHDKSSGWGGGLEMEMKLLPELAKQVDVRIPEILFSGNQSNGLPFVGYEKIPGVKLSKKVMSQLSDFDKNKVFEDLAQFVHQMHDFSTKKAVHLGVVRIDFRSNYESDSLKVRKRVFPLLNKPSQKYLGELLDKYLNDSGNFDYKACPLHADLWPEHVLVVGEAGGVVGVYDFGDVIVGDPDYEFMQFHQVFGEKALILFERFIRFFDKDRVARKSLFFQQWNIVQDLMFYQDIGDREGVEYNLGKVAAFVK